MSQPVYPAPVESCQHLYTVSTVHAMLTLARIVSIVHTARIASTVTTALTATIVHMGAMDTVRTLVYNVNSCAQCEHLYTL